MADIGIAGSSTDINGLPQTPHCKSVIEPAESVHQLHVHVRTLHTVPSGNGSHSALEVLP